MKTQIVTEQLSNLTQELRRGVLPLAVLSMLRENKYGYALINDLAQFGIEIDQGTLYPMLRRLETQGLLQSSWLIEGTRPRRYYAISAAGSEVLELLSKDWKNLNTLMDKLLGNLPAKNGEKNELN
jgi:PadR family transcriptional regulator, regulatory protein PadR